MAVGFPGVGAVEDDMETKTIILDLDGANCPGCIYTIERAGRRLAGVSEVRVDAGRQEVRVDCDGRPGVGEAVRDIVRLLGHDARIRPGPAA